ncbi:MAG: hypothetical protein AAF628_21345 [Planctomycetota bacterium]
MRKLIAALLISCCLWSGCASGPHQLRRTVDDWDHQLYVESPWLNAVLMIVPVIPIAGFLGGVGDFLIGDAYSFWFKDAWDGKGTGFVHFNPKATDGAMKSLLLDDGKFLEVK